MVQRPLKILIVDDSPVVHKLMTRILQGEGHIVCATAKNGQEAVQFHAQEQPDLTFMDITMPILDGIGALTEIKQASPQAMVIMLSAMGDEQLVQQATQLGASLFLQKPFYKESVSEAIATVLEGRG